MKTKPKSTAAEDSPEVGPLDWRRLVQWLQADGVISAEEATRTVARCASAHSAQHPLQRLAVVAMARAADGHVLDAEMLTEWLAARAGLTYQRIDPLKVDVGKVADVMSAAYAERHKVLPLQVGPGEVVVATSEPFVRDWVPEVERQTRRNVRLVLASPADISRYTAEFFALAKSVRAASKAGGAAGFGSFEQLVELGKSNKQLDANDQGVVQLVDWLWQYAFDQRASDIHLEPRREQGVIRFRIDGVLHPVYQMPMGVLNAMIARIKLLGRMDVVERRRPQDGRIKTLRPGIGDLKGDEVEMRLSTLPTAFGEKLVMRIFDPEVIVRSYAELGFSEAEATTWKQLIQRPSGIVLVTGPTGSGKTSTLYSTLRELATDEVNVSTVEDPIENIEPALNQMQVQHGIDLGFADGLRALMRQDPDVIMVGEIRDKETADMAVNAALTGHLVFSTLHTNDAASSIARLIELGVPHYLVNATVIGILAQRLVRTLCPHCKQETDPPDETVWKDLVAPWRSKLPRQVFKPVGCLECRRTGYCGRPGLIELLVVSDEIRRLVAEGADLAALRNQAARDGLRSLRVSGAEKIAKGVTTLDEVLRAAPPFNP